MQENKSNILIYQTEDGVTKIETRLLDETVWLTQAQMATLFDKGRVTITEHINNIFKEGELNENSVSRKSRLARICNPCPQARADNTNLKATTNFVR
jgi:hypothetical protein